jgi:glycosyltransferase involved in cell wall biosynthesis
VYFNGPAPADPVLASPAIRVRALGGAPVRGVVFQERRLPPALGEDRPAVFFSPAYSCPRRIAVPRATAIHDLSFFSLPEDFAWLDGLRRRLTVTASLALSDAILACSDFTRREILARFPEAEGRVHHVPLGPDDDIPAGPPREEARRSLGVNGPMILAVGAILNRRRLPELLRAVAALRQEHPGLVLDVVGENRTQPRRDLAGLVRSLDLEGAVRLSGFISDPDLAVRYAAADVACCLSDYEGFGLPALEALSRGLPLVASGRPSLGEIFGEAALLTDPADVPGIAGALGRVLRDEALRSDLVGRGRALAARFSWKRTAALTWDVLLATARP